MSNMIDKVMRRLEIYWQNISHLDIKLLKKGKGLQFGRYFYQKEYVDFQIKQGDKVLDIGSGGYPFPLATHLADFYEGKTSHRYEDLKRDDRPLIICNLESTPFADKEFDFVYCSHVLEHVDAPEQACEELMRIGKRGYIETPSKISDTMFNFTKIPNHHKWHIQLLGNTLIFMEWKPSERRDLGTDYFFHQYHSKWKNHFQDLVWNNRDLFVNMMLWEERFDYVVISNKGEIIASNKSMADKTK